MRKRARIAELEDQVSDLRAQLPYADISRDIHARVQRRIAQIDEPDLEQAFAASVAETEASLVRRQIWQKIGQLPTEKVLQWYANHFGSEEVEALLGQRAEMEVNWMAANSHLEPMRIQGERQGIADLSLTKPSDTLVFSIARENRLAQFTFRRLQEDFEQGLGFAAVEGTEQIRGAGGLRSNEVVLLGGAYVPGSSFLEPVISLGSELSCWEFEYGGPLQYRPTPVRGPITSLVVNNMPVLQQNSIQSPNQ